MGSPLCRASYKPWIRLWSSERVVNRYHHHHNDISMIRRTTMITAMMTIMMIMQVTTKRSTCNASLSSSRPPTRQRWAVLAFLFWWWWWGWWQWRSLYIQFNIRRSNLWPINLLLSDLQHQSLTNVQKCIFYFSTYFLQTFKHFSVDFIKLVCYFVIIFSPYLSS